MADIKNMAVFGGNRGLDRIKEHRAKSELVSDNNRSIVPRKRRDTELSPLTSETPLKTSQKDSKSGVAKRPPTQRVKEGKGAPIRCFDKTLATSNSIRLSFVLNTLTKILVEKYEVDTTKDELLRKALNEFIKTHYTLEDKQDIYTNLQNEIENYRIKNPTLDNVDIDGNIIESSEEIEKRNAQALREAWAMSKK